MNNFPGLGDNGAVTPPDTMGAAGPMHLVSVLNSEVAVFEKKTGAILQRQPLSEFWQDLFAAPNGVFPRYPFDPKALYDQHSGRFIVVCLNGAYAPGSWILLAVSVASDPTQGWNQWAIDADLDNNAQQFLNWADFPRLGVDNSNIYITANMLENSLYPHEGAFRYSKAWVVPKTQLLAPHPPGRYTLTRTEFRNPIDPGASGPSTMGYTLQPVHVFGETSAVYVIHEGYFSGADRFLRISSITFPPPGTPVWTDLGFIRVAPYPVVGQWPLGLPMAPQLGTNAGVDTGDTSLSNAVFRNGRIFTAHTVSDNTTTRTEAAWYEIDPTRAAPDLPPPVTSTPIQQGRISDPDRYYYYPSLAVNANADIGMGFSGSSPTEYVSAYYTVRAWSDPPGTMQAINLLKAGLGPYFKDSGGGINRWGDYSVTCMDPVDDMTFWTLQEFAGSPDNTWATWWGSFALPPPPSGGGGGGGGGGCTISSTKNTPTDIWPDLTLAVLFFLAVANTFRRFWRRSTPRSKSHWVRPS